MLAVYHYAVNSRKLLLEISVQVTAKPEDDTKDGDRESRDDSLKKTFVDIAETIDEDMEKGEMEALSPKKESCEEKDDIISSLRKQLEDQRRANKLAEKALSQLEDIDKILSGSTKLRCNLTCRNVCQPCPTLAKKTDDNKKQRLEDLMRERDDLRLRVSELEKQLAGCTDCPKNSEELGGVSADELQKRLDQVIGLETKVQELVNQLQDEETMAKNAVAQTRDPKEAEKCKAKIAELEKELEKSKFLKVENAKLQMKIQELLYLEKSQDELKKKMGTLEGEYKLKYDGLCKMENECNALRVQLANAKLLQKERDMLRRQVGDLECCVADLEDEIKRLVGHIDRLTQGRDEQQTKTQNAMSDIRVELEKKTLLIEKSEEKLATVQEELEKSINGVRSETQCYKTKIEDLEKIVAIKTEEINILKNNLEQKDKIIDDLNRSKKANEELFRAEDAKSKSLRQDLENSIRQNEKLRREMEKMIAFKTEENSTKKIILQSKSAIRRVREEIDRQYREWEMGAGEDCTKVNELKGMVKTLEAEASRMKRANDELRGALENQKTCNCLAGLENKTLKKHSAEIQNIAKHQVEELLDHLKKAQLRIVELEDTPGDRTRLNPETKDSEISCDCDKEEIERLMKENEVLKEMLKTERPDGKLEEALRETEKEDGDRDLLKEIERLKNEISSLESDKLKLEKENDNLKTKSQFKDNETAPDNLELQGMLNEKEKLCASLRDEIEKLKREIESLKEALEETRRQLGISNKQAQASAMDVQNLENNMKEQKDTTGKMRQELEDLKRKNNELNDKLAEMEKIKKQLTECLEREKNDNKQIASSQTKLKTENDNLKSDAAETEKLKKQLADCLERERKINAEKTSTEEDLKKEIERLKKATGQQDTPQDDSLKKENESLKNALAEMEKVKKQLTECLEREKNKSPDDSLKKENDNLKNALAEMEKVKKQLAECLEKEKNKSPDDSLKKENDSLKNALAEMEKVKKQLAECLEKEKNKSPDDSLKKENDNLKNALAEMEKVKKQLAECLEKEKSKSPDDSLKKENDNLKNALAEMEKVKKQLSECLEKEKDKAPDDSLKKEIGDLKNALAEMEKVKKQLAECLENEKKNSAKNASSEVELKKENDKLKNTLKELEDVKKKLAECLEEEKNKNKGLSDADALKKENGDLKNKLKELADVKAELAACLEREKKARGDADDALKKLETANSGKKDSNILQTKIEQLQRQLDDCLAREKKIAEKESFQSAVQALPGDVDKLENDNKRLGKELDELRKKLTAATGENAKLKAEIDELKKRLETAGKPSATNEPEQKSVAAEKPGAKESTVKKDEEKEAVTAAADANEDDLRAEIDRLLKKLSEQKSECDKTIRSLKEQYDRDVKNIHKANQKSIEELQRQHSEQLQDLEGRHDSAVKDLREELRRSLQVEDVPTRDTAGDDRRDRVLSAHTFCVCSEMPKVMPIITTVGADIGVHEVDSPYDRPGRWPRPRPPRDSAINQLLYKAITLGMEKMTLEELQIIHSEVLNATRKIKGKIPASMMQSTVEDSTALMNRIEELKDNLEKKQRTAKQKVVSLHLSIRAMEQKILETRNVLEKEKDHNAELRARLMAMERDSQLMQVDRDLMKQQTNLQEQQIAKLQKTCQCKKQKKKEVEGESKKKKYFKRSRRDSFSSDSTEILENRIQTTKKRSSSTPVPGGRCPHHIPTINPIIPSDDSQRNKRERHACSCCSARGSDKKNQNK
ncbi:restin homolog isoform X2 [Coccinella septempunctata]|uniref:restin homolog isoform X2 n=1 Tax=Coccinella septempunctata TaxID=41139 RepID=UPI001D05D14B|nr:restin homolog isoform X2 [Coccinella septempunctata]